MKIFSEFAKIFENNERKTEKILVFIFEVY